MKRNLKFKRISALLMAMLLVSTAFVSTVYAKGIDEQSVQSTQVDNASLNARTPPVIQELRNRGLSEKEIAQSIIDQPIKRQEGWTEEDNKRVIEYFKKVQEALKSNETKNKEIDSKVLQNEETQNAIVQSYVQKDGRMYIDEENYRGINGYMYPGPMEVSSEGTQIQYLTSHLGADGVWIEIGVARFEWSPDELVVFTFDSTKADQAWETWGTTDSNTDHNFEIYVHNFNDGQGYPFYLAWEGNVIRTGHVPFNTGNPDEVHEYFAQSVDTFTSVSIASFKESYLYRGNTALWWNGYLPETTHSYGLSPVKVVRYVPSNSNAYRINSWIP